MTQYLIIPGLGNSGPEHWQTWLEQTGPPFRRIEQQEWDSPDCDTWIAAIDAVVNQYDPSTVVLIAHSMGCTAVAHWAGRYGQHIKGALLVAPSDLEAPAYTFTSTGFTPIPLAPLPFPTLIVASTNDVWVSPERAAFFAECWGSDLNWIGEAGHINAASGHGPWPQALAFLERLEG